MVEGPPVGSPVVEGPASRESGGGGTASRESGGGTTTRRESGGGGGRQEGVRWWRGQLHPHLHHPMIRKDVQTL